MGTLYDLLGALPGDDAEGLRRAFRKAAKATHPDINPENPEAAVRFRELVRAYDILNDAEQRATYDQLLAIALRPSATNATRTYEGIHKFASNTMAATVISAVLVGGYALFGMFSKPPVAAEIVGDRTAGRSEPITALTPAEAIAASEAETSAVGAVTSAKNANAGAFDRLEPVPAFATFNLAIKYTPRTAPAYFDRQTMLYRMGAFDRPFADVVPARRMTDSKRSRTAAPVPPRPIAVALPTPYRRTPMTAALTP